MIRKPMLAAGLTEAKHFQAIAKHYPLLASRKIDGIRCLIHPEHGPCTRTFKAIPNDYIRSALERLDITYLDGELVTRNPDGTLRSFNEVQGDVMRVAGRPDFQLLVFDCFRYPNAPFHVRLDHARETAFGNPMPEDGRVSILPHLEVSDEHELFDELRAAMDLGYEGLMLRHRHGEYKEGRSTVNQAWLLKVKVFEDAEGTIIGFEERMHNANEATKDLLGHTERSSHQENLVPMGTLGAVILDTAWGELKVGTGFNDAVRQAIWDRRSEFMGRIMTFTYQPFGQKEKPRFPSCKGFRPELEANND